MTPRTLTRAALLLLAAALAVVALAAMAAAQTDPPGAGADWNITNDVTTVTGTDIHIDGNISVVSGSRLNLRNLTLTMHPAEDQLTTLYIEAGSTLSMYNVRVRSADASRHFWFEVRGIANITGCDIRDLAGNDKDRISYGFIAGGLQIYDSNTTLTDTDVHDCQRICVYVREANPLITGCDFYNSEYVFTATEMQYVYYPPYYGYYAFVYLDATGLFLYGSSPVIERCTFYTNGIPSTAVGYYSTSSDPCFVETWGRGLLAADSSPRIGNCTFTDNGLNPADRVIGGIQCIYQDGLYAYYDDTFPVEGGIGVVGTSAPIINWTTISNNNLFGIVGKNAAPALINHTTISGASNVRGNSVSNPCGAIYLESTGGGACVIENVYMYANVVVANIYADGPSLTLSNITNGDNRVSNGYNLYLGSGTHTISNCSLDGRASGGGDPMMTNILMYGWQGQNRLVIWDSRIYGAEYVIYTQGSTSVTAYNSTLTSTGNYAFYLYGSNVDCIDCIQVFPERAIGYNWGGASTVRIMYHVAFDVRWQSEDPVSHAFLQVKNATGEFIHGGITGADGGLGPLLLAAKTMLISGSSSMTITNTPIYAQAYSSGLQSVQYKFDFNGKHVDPAYRVTIYDTRDPEIYIFAPVDGKAYGSTNLSVYGMCLDIGSGVRKVDVQADSGAWHVTEGTEAWSVYLDLKEGKHLIVVRAEDRAGNIVLKQLRSVTIDLTPPELEILDPVKDTWYASALNYTLRGYTRGQVQLAINGRVVEVEPDGYWSSAWDLNSGSNEFTIRSTDIVGNYREVVKVIVRDSTVPKLILTSPQDGSWTNISQVEVKGITEIGATVYVNGEPVPTYSGRFASTLFLTEGENRISVDAVDRAGNVMPLTRTVVLDSVPPVLRIESPLGSGMVADRTLDIRGTLDDGTISNIVVNGLLVPVEGLRFQKSFRLEEGLNIVTVEAWDRAQNYASRTFRITLDTLPPMLQVIEPDGNIVTRQSTLDMRGRVEPGVTFRITGSPNAIDNDLVTRLEDTFRFTDYPLRAGTNTLTYEAVDAVGNVARVVRTVQYDLEPPELLITAVPAVTYREIIELSGVLRNGTSVSVDRIPVVVEADGSFVQSVHLRPGENAITVTALDDAGNEAVRVVNVTRASVPEPPRGILGAGPGASIALVVVMLVIGLAVLYPAFRGRGREAAAPGTAPTAPAPAEAPTAPGHAAGRSPPRARRRRGAPPPPDAHGPPPPPPAQRPEDGGQAPPWR